jgi:hypothetical protein
MKPTCQYVCLYNGKRLELEAGSSYEAQTKAAAHFKATKKPWQVTVVLAEKDAQSVVHLPLF